MITSLRRTVKFSHMPGHFDGAHMLPTNVLKYQEHLCLWFTFYRWLKHINENNLVSIHNTSVQSTNDCDFPLSFDNYYPNSWKANIWASWVTKKPLLNELILTSYICKFYLKHEIQLSSKKHLIVKRCVINKFPLLEKYPERKNRKIYLTKKLIKK